MESLMALAQILEVSVDWLLFGEERGIFIPIAPEGTSPTLPVLGEIACDFEGVTNEALADAERLPVPPSWVQRGGYCLVHAAGDSMEDAGIHPGDLVALARVTEADIQPDGKTIYAMLTWEDQACRGVCLKRLASQDGELWVIPAKHGLLPRRLSQLGDRVRVFARVIGVIREIE
jgi:SOS-response transcriptional repressor LexA